MHNKVNLTGTISNALWWHGRLISTITPGVLHRPLALDDCFNRITRAIRPSLEDRCLFLIKYPRPVFIKTWTWIEESHMVLGATEYWPLVCHSSFHPSLCWLRATVETPSQGQPTNSRARFGLCTNDATWCMYVHDDAYDDFIYTALQGIWRAT
jgi:hypothetical protein